MCNCNIIAVSTIRKLLTCILSRWLC